MTDILFLYIRNNQTFQTVVETFKIGNILSNNVIEHCMTKYKSFYLTSFSLNGLSSYC